MSDRLALLDSLIQRLDSPISENDRRQIQDALRGIRWQAEQDGYVKFAEGYQAGYDRGEADALAISANTPAADATCSDLLEHLAADLATGRAQMH